MGEQPIRVHWDFQGTDREGRAILQWRGIDDELAWQGATLFEGAKVLLWEDETMPGKERELMIVEGTACFDQRDNRWAAIVDWSTFRRE